MATPGWKKIPFLRWSFWRLAFNMKQLLTNWQVGDGREDKLVAHVLATARRGDIADALRTIDEFAYNTAFLINVGDEKGQILDRAVESAKPKRILELGTYCGYSALRMAQAAPEARIHSVEFSAANAELARRIFTHAGVAERVTVIVGSLGDGGVTARKLREEHEFGAGVIDLVFVDHAKDAYLPDLRLIEKEGWLHPGSVVVADNVKFPGAPEYRAYMRDNEGKGWRTTEHAAHAEYQTVFKDLVLVSERLV
jgi:catechol O-methyltransferase